jgi:two-component system alkaline phosphatase synthesis response regulator PhoP
VTKQNTKKKILIVEDEESLLSLLRDEFTLEGFEVFTAPDGLAGYEITLEKHPDIVLIDILMPKMDGISMLKKLSEHRDFLTVPAIILTNLNDAKTISAALESGAYDYLVKSNQEPKTIVRKVKEKLHLS